MKTIYKYLLNTLPRPLLIRLSYVFKLFAPIAFKGSNVECPVCERKFRKFLSYGSDVAHRENVLCPYDLTLERHRLLWLYLKQSNFFSEKKLELTDFNQKLFDRFKLNEQFDSKYSTCRRCSSSSLNDHCFLFRDERNVRE